MMITRRKLFVGLTGLIAAPAIVRASSLMPVKAFVDRPITTFMEPIDLDPRFLNMSWGHREDGVIYATDPQGVPYYLVSSPDSDWLVGVYGDPKPPNPYPA